MSYKIINLTPLGNGKNGKVPCMFMYWNEDADTVTTEDYFQKDCGLKNGDQVVVISKDYKSKSNYYVEVNATSFKITLKASS